MAPLSYQQWGVRAMDTRDPFALYRNKQEIQRAITCAKGEIEPIQYTAYIWVCARCGESERHHTEKVRDRTCQECGTQMMKVPERVAAIKPKEEEPTEEPKAVMSEEKPIPKCSKEKRIEHASEDSGTSDGNERLRRLIQARRAVERQLLWNGEHNKQKLEGAVWGCARCGRAMKQARYIKNPRCCKCNTQMEEAFFPASVNESVEEPESLGRIEVEGARQKRSVLSYWIK
jgi:DNA-directed RNA polymerase subunit RPC12/RpoP